MVSTDKKVVFNTIFHWQLRQGVQGLQAFAFCLVTVNDEHTKPRFKRKLRG